MTWFDRNPGGKKSVETVPEKVSEAPKPAPEAVAVAVAPEPKPVPKLDVAPPPPSPSPSIAGLVGYLYKGSRVSGQLSFQGAVRIEGTVDGEIHCRGALTIGESAEVRAKISGQIVVIQGKVEGNVTAKERVELLAPARLIGNLNAPRVVIAEGVVFEGECSMGVARQKSAVASAQVVSVDRVAAASTAKLQADSKS
jgi:cytoskeletal protein CcmA (bactofilin family)